MSERSDPTRWLESGFLAEEHARDLSAYGRQGAATASRERMLAQLSARIGEAAPVVVQPTLIGKLKLWLGSAALLAGAMVALPLLPAAPAPKVLRAPAEQHQVASLRLVPLVALAAHREPAPEVAAPLPRKPSALPPPPPAAVPERSDVLGELTMLARARRALLNDPMLALLLSDEHARSFPRGTFEEEREVLAIESLLKLQRLDEARARVRGFALRFPRSAQRAHLAKLIANPGE